MVFRMKLELYFRYIAISSICALLGCVGENTIPVTVLSFHAGEGNKIQTGKTYTIVPMRRELNHSLEFQFHARELAAILNGQGYTPETTLDRRPQLIFMFDYAQLPAEVDTEVIQNSTMEPWPGALRETSYAMNPPFVTATRQRAIVRARYPRQVQIDIIDGSRSSQKWFEGTAVAYSKDISGGSKQLVSALIRALLMGVTPSTSGVQRHVLVTFPDHKSPVVESHY